MKLDLSSNKKLLMTGLSLSTAWISLQLAGVKRENNPPQTSNFPGSEPKNSSFLDLQKAPMFFLPEGDLNSLTRSMFLFLILLLQPED